MFTFAEPAGRKATSEKVSLHVVKHFDKFDRLNVISVLM